jgi:hypothetical protein
MKDEGGRMKARLTGSSGFLSSLIPHPSSLPLRGDVSALAILRESLRRVRVAASLRRERATLTRSAFIARVPRLGAEFAAMSASQLLAHFRSRETPKFPHGIESDAQELSRLAREKFPRETEELIERARKVVEEQRWSLLGCGEFEFGARAVGVEPARTSRRARARLRSNFG